MLLAKKTFGTCKKDKKKGSNTNFKDRKNNMMETPFRIIFCNKFLIIFHIKKFPRS